MVIVFLYNIYTSQRLNFSFTTSNHSPPQRPPIYLDIITTRPFLQTTYNMQLVNFAFLGLAASTSVAATAAIQRRADGAWAVSASRVDFPDGSFDRTLFANFTSFTQRKGLFTTCRYHSDAKGSGMGSCDDATFSYTLEGQSEYTPQYPFGVPAFAWTSW